MSSQYEQIMEQVKVTEEMRGRILHRVEQSGRPQQRTRQRHPILKILLPVAACFAVILGLFFLSEKAADPPVQPQITNPMTQAQSVQELSDLVGFEVVQVSKLPFEVQTVTYTAYYNQLAEIKYIGQTNTCVLRQSGGTGDISGDYSSYALEENRRIGEVEVLLKGQSADHISSAIWTQNGISFSLVFSEGVSLEVCEAAVASVGN